MKFSFFKYKGLFWAFVKRDIHERIAGSTFGPLLLFLQPLSQILVYIFLFKYIFNVKIRVSGSFNEDFLRFFLAGFIPWSIHNEAIFRASNSLLAQGHLLKKVLFPPEILPLSSALGCYLLGIPAIFILLFILLFTGGLAKTSVLVFVLYSIQFFLSLGVSLIFAAILVYLRDLQMFLGIIVSVWFYITPILYSIEMIPSNLRFLFYFNPFTYLIRLWQNALLGFPLFWMDFILALCSSFMFLVVGIWFFRKCKEGFADVL